MQTNPEVALQQIANISINNWIDDVRFDNLALFYNILLLF